MIHILLIDLDIWDFFKNPPSAEQIVCLRLEYLAKKLCLIYIFQILFYNREVVLQTKESHLLIARVLMLPTRQAETFSVVTSVYS